ncbi:unnamed protein product [Cercospora beticola]|nr:unnamed protein product [Cercospora beticola]
MAPGSEGHGNDTPALSRVQLLDHCREPGANAVLGRGAALEDRLGYQDTKGAEPRVSRLLAHATRTSQVSKRRLSMAIHDVAVNSVRTFWTVQLGHLSPVNKGIPSLSRALACGQSLLPLLQEEYEGILEKPNSERDIRAFHLAEYFDSSGHPVSFARNALREAVYAADVARSLSRLSQKEFIERQKAARADAKAVVAHLPNALDRRLSENVIGHYLIYLKDKSNFAKDTAYGAASGAYTNVCGSTCLKATERHRHRRHCTGSGTMRIST